jgi:hypothetical protein
MNMAACRSAGFAGAALLALVGCGASDGADAIDPARKTRAPADVVRAAIASGTAEEISRQCSGEFRYNRDHENEVQTALATKYGANGVPGWAENPDGIMSELEIQDAAIAYIQRRRIVMTQAETWCAAGRLEVERQTEIGKYLVAR